tara:strand:+ start:141 stop:629 length:489 start_codon:yes stop_codon:yes gene_type:complete
MTKIKVEPVNPFFRNVECSLHVIKVVTKKKYKTVTDEGGAVFLPYEYLQEKQKSIKVYDSPQIEEVLYKSLKAMGRDLFLYMLYNVQKDKDTITMDIPKTCEKLGIVRVSYYRGMQQLVDAGILCKKKCTEYWINPYFFFNGDRIALYQKHDRVVVDYTLNK